MPFAQQFITLSKQAHIELVAQARYWKSQHARALERLAHSEERLEEQRKEASEREAALRSELEQATAKIRDLQQRLFGRKTEKHRKTEARRGQASGRRRGQQPGTPGHGRTRLSHLPVRDEDVGLDQPTCPDCGLPLQEFPGTADSEVIEIAVKAYRRRIRRKRYRCRCGCEALPGIITAPAPPALIERGKFGISVWVKVLLDKFLYGRPSHRLLSELADHGLDMAAGTLTGGLQALAPLFAPLDQALREKLRSEPHWHADETRWNVFVECEGKVGHRWWLWVFQSVSVAHFVIDPSRSTAVIEKELGSPERGIISADRYAAYRKYRRLHPGIILSLCWAHQRRDVLMLANDHPDLHDWAMALVDGIGLLFHLCALRVAADGDAFAALDIQLRQSVQAMAEQRRTALAETSTAAPVRKLLLSMERHWDGLTTFLDHPQLPMDNTAAERTLRGPVVGRKNFYGSGSKWSASLAATMYSVLATVRLWGLNEYVWLTEYLTACAQNGRRPPADLAPFLPWSMDKRRLTAMQHPRQSDIERP
jgi:transposase